MVVQTTLAYFKQKAYSNSVNSSINKAKTNFTQNCNKGSTLEDFIKIMLNKSNSIKEHKTWERGLDVETLDSSVAIESLNWYGGYIHPERFTKIVDNLKVLGCKAQYKVFVCAGVKPTKEQRMFLKAYGIRLILLPAMTKGIDEWKPLFVKALVREGVITLSISFILLNDKTIQVPSTVIVTDDLDGNNPHEVLAWNLVLKFRNRNNEFLGWID